MSNCILMDGKALSNKIRELAHSSRNRLKDPNPFSNLLFGKVEYNKTNKYV